MEKEIESLLIDTGFEPHQKGFRLIIESLLVILENNCQTMMIRDIYNKVCADESIKYCTYDRNIRHSIECSYLNDYDLFRHMFDGQRPKVKEALYRLSLEIKMNKENE